MTVVGVEAAASPGMSTAIRAGKITPVEVRETLADGLAGNLEPGIITVDLIREHVDRLVSVTEEQIADAIRYLAREHGLIAEGSGAVPGCRHPRRRHPGHQSDRRRHQRPQHRPADAGRRAVLIARPALSGSTASAHCQPTALAAPSGAGDRCARVSRLPRFVARTWAMQRGTSAIQRGRPARHADSFRRTPG